MISTKTRLPAACAIVAKNSKSSGWAARAWPLARQPGGLAQHQATGLEDVTEHADVEPAGAEQQVGDHVEAPVLAPIAHAHRVAVAHLDETHLLEPLERLAHDGHRHAEVGGQRALAGQLLAGRV